MRLASKRAWLEPVRVELEADTLTVSQHPCSRHASGLDASTARLANAGAARLPRPAGSAGPRGDKAKLFVSSFTRPPIDGGSGRLRTWTLSGRGAARYRVHSR